MRGASRTRTNVTTPSNSLVLSKVLSRVTSSLNPGSHSVRGLAGGREVSRLPPSGDEDVVGKRLRGFSKIVLFKRGSTALCADRPRVPLDFIRAHIRAHTHTHIRTRACTSTHVSAVSSWRTPVACCAFSEVLV